MIKLSSPVSRWVAVSCLAVAGAALSACDKGPDESRANTLAEGASLPPSTPAPPATSNAPRVADESASVATPPDRPKATTTSSPAQAQPARAARAELHSSSDSGVAGVIEFVQEGRRITVTGKVTGLQPGEHGFHIHQNGDCSAPDGSSAGGHFAPYNRDHGARVAPAVRRHVGDLGNIVAAADGTAELSISDDVIRLEGAKSIVDRAVIIHAQADDPSSQPSGDAGGRVACGVVREMIEKTAPPTPIALRGQV